MAQDFYAAFGKDKYGTIGNDSSINQADFLGINFIAIQALEKRTTELKNEISEVKNQNTMLNKKLADVDDGKAQEVNQLKKENESLQQSVAKLQMQFDGQQKLIAQSLDQLNVLSIKPKDKEDVTVKNRK
ncbi:MAG: hypothetical protein ABIX01_01090 [Chitinophagaceae bacterium]